MKRLNFFAVLLLFSSVISCAFTGTKISVEDATAHYKLGVAFLDTNKIQRAFVEFQKAYEFNPNDQRVLNAIGIIYLLHFNETEESIKHFKKALKIDPDYSDANNNLGYAYEKSGRYETAISYYQKAVSNLTYPTPEKAYISMGNSYYRLGKFASAVKSYSEAIKRAPDLSTPYLGLALCFNALGRYGDASSAMTKAIKLDPGYQDDTERAREDLELKKHKSTGADARDIRDYLEILNY